MAKRLPFRLVVPEGLVFDGDIIEVQVPTPGGPISVLADHMPMVTPISTGVLVIHEEGEKPDHYAVSGGTLNITGGGATLAATAAVHADSIDMLEAQKHLTEARAQLSTVLTDEEIAMTEGAVERNLARLAAAERHKNYHARH